MAKKTGKAASKARRAATKKKKKSSSSSSSSKSSSSSSKSSSSGKYETTDGKKFSNKSDATAHQRKLNSSGKGVGTTYDKTTGRGSSSYKEPEKKEKEKEEKSDYVRADDSELRNSEEFKALGKDDQEAVLAVFKAVASNDAAQANRLAQAFKTATKLNAPYFNEQLRLAIDAIERGYVEIEKEAEYKEMQLKRRRDDVRADYEKRKEFLTLEEASDMRSIERQYTTELEDTRQMLAATGKSSSSQRVQKEEILESTFGDLRASTRRKFAFEQDAEATNVARTDRDTQAELARLEELTKAGKLDFLRKGEEQVGSKNLPRLDANYKPLGNIYGDIERNRIEDTLNSAVSFVF